MFVLDAAGTADDADIILDFSARRRDEIEIENAGGTQIQFVEDGRNTQIFADGTLIATLNRADPADVAARTSFDAPPASVEVIETDVGGGRGLPRSSLADMTMADDSFDFGALEVHNAPLAGQATAEISAVRSRLDEMFETARTSFAPEDEEQASDWTGSDAHLFSDHPLL